MMEQSYMTKLTIPKTGKLRAVIDTDTYNEIDDQFALAYFLHSQDRLIPEAIYAAPFFNEKSTSPGDGMEKSYQEIHKVLQIMGKSNDVPSYRGSGKFLESTEEPILSDAVHDLIERALLPSDSPLYVIAIGAATNIASALVIEPKIRERIFVVWLGGHGIWMDSTQEFNLAGDLTAGRYLFSSGVPLIQIPCVGVTSELRVTLPELEAYLDGKNKLCTMLCQNVRETKENHFAYSRSIWDVGAVAYLIQPDWFTEKVIPAPGISDDFRWVFQSETHPVKTCLSLNRDAIIGDLYTKLLL